MSAPAAIIGAPGIGLIAALPATWVRVQDPTPALVGGSTRMS
jgi:hypothetical protein